MKDFVDDLYRRANEDPDIPFNEQAWDQMELKLDYAERKRRRGLILLFFILLLTVGMSLLWGFGYLEKNPKWEKTKYDHPVAKNLWKQEKTPAQKPRTDKNSAHDQLVEASELRFNARNEQSQGNLNPRGNQTAHSSEAKTRLFTTQQRGLRKLNKAPQQTDFSVKDADKQWASDKIVGLSAVLNPHPESLTVIPPDSTNVTVEKNEGWITQVLPAKSLLHTLQYQSPVWKINSNDAYAGPLSKPPVKAKSWGLGLSAGPDLAAVNGNGSTAYGLNAGLAFDYRIGKRWVFQGSGQYLLKNYIADQREYVAPAGFWPTHSYPKSTEGTCDMLQWSVDLRYNWLAKPKFQSFVALGSSSWTILNEEYEFYYAKDYPGLIHHWSSGQNKNYWFSMAQMGIGVEKSIRPGLSLQVNWFAQMPLKGVGNGKVEIYSSGLGFMVRKLMGSK